MANRTPRYFCALYGVAGVKLYHNTVEYLQNCLVYVESVPGTILLERDYPQLKGASRTATLYRALRSRLVVLRDANSLTPSRVVIIGQIGSLLTKGQVLFSLDDITHFVKRFTDTEMLDIATELSKQRPMLFGENARDVVVSKILFALIRLGRIDALIKCYRCWNAFVSSCRDDRTWFMNNISRYISPTDLEYLITSAREPSIPDSLNTVVTLRDSYEYLILYSYRFFSPSEVTERIKQTDVPTTELLQVYKNALDDYYYEWASEFHSQLP